MRRLLPVILAALFLAPVYAMGGNALWIGKNYNETIYIYANTSTVSSPINPGESYTIEYDAYLAEYNAIGKYDDVVLDDVSLKVVNQSNNLYYICIDGNGDGNGLDLWTNMIRTENASKYTINDFLGQERHIKMVITKINDTNYRVEAYVDNDLIGYGNYTGNLTNIRTFFFGSVAGNVSFKMAIDDVKITLPNGTELYEDFEDNDWNRIFGYHYGSSNKYGIAPAPNQPVRTPIPLGAVIISYTLILFIVLRKR